MPTPQKAAVIETLTEKLGRSQLTVVTDYRGLSVRDLAALRRQLQGLKTEYTVAKNTLLRIAARNNGIDGADAIFEGPTAIAICYEDVIGSAKAIADFARTSRILTVRGAVLGNRVIDATGVNELATLPSPEQLRAQLVGTISGPLASLVGVLNGVLQQLVGTLEARSEQMGAAA